MMILMMEWYRPSLAYAAYWLWLIIYNATFDFLYLIAERSDVNNKNVSGVTTGPADPAMRGAYGGPKLWHYFFTENLKTAILVITCAAMSNGWSGCSVDILSLRPFVS